MKRSSRCCIARYRIARYCIAEYCIMSSEAFRWIIVMVLNGSLGSNLRLRGRHAYSEVLVGLEAHVVSAEVSRC